MGFKDALLVDDSNHGENHDEENEGNKGNTAQKMNFSIKDFFSKDFFSFVGIWSRLLKKSLMKNFTFCAVQVFFIITYYLIP